MMMLPMPFAFDITIAVNAVTIMVGRRSHP
jgi:hypothetical protein